MMRLFDKRKETLNTEINENMRLPCAHFKAACTFFSVPAEREQPKHKLVLATHRHQPSSQDAACSGEKPIVLKEIR
jgi:hypothetical protein